MNPVARGHGAVYRALKAGLLSRLPCQRCGEGNAIAHHDDYAKPLDVTWLCRICHKARHREIGIFRKIKGEWQWTKYSQGGFAFAKRRYGISKKTYDQRVAGKIDQREYNRRKTGVLLRRQAKYLIQLRQWRNLLYHIKCWGRSTLPPKFPVAALRDAVDGSPIAYNLPKPRTPLF